MSRTLAEVIAARNEANEFVTSIRHQLVAKHRYYAVATDIETVEIWDFDEPLDPITVVDNPDSDVNMLAACLNNLLSEEEPPQL